MSQITKRALEQSLKNLLREKPLSKITVTDITEDCGISRMTFYYHFKDIYDLVEWACAEDVARAAAQAAYDKKGEDVQVLDLTELSDVCDYFVLATGANNRQVDSIVDEIEEKVAEACGEHPFSIEGREQKTWMLMDYGSVVVHVFTPEARDFYRLEKLWGDAPQLPLNLL